MVYPGPFSPGNSPYDLSLWIGNTEYPLILGTDDKGNLLFQQRTAPTIPPVIQGGVQSLDSRSVPPEQGIDLTVGDVSGGAGSWLAKPGRYAFGDNVETAYGIVEPGPGATATAAEDGFVGEVRSQARFMGHSWVGTSQGYVYWWDYAFNSNVGAWRHLDNQPDASGNPITDLQVIAIPSGASVLIALMDTAATYQYLTNDVSVMGHVDLTANTGTWKNPDPASGGQRHGKHGCVLQNTTLTPVFVMVNDPNEVYTSENPTDTAFWSTASYIGDPADAAFDHFTSVTVSPNGVDVFVGKKVGLYTFNNVSGEVQQLERVGPDRGVGLENFAWLQRMGGNLFAPALDYDTVQVDRYGQVTWGYGPYRSGPNVPEMQRAVVALAADDREWVYVALEGPLGRVMKFRYQDDGRIHYHGAYVTLFPTANPEGPTVIANRMWYGADPTSEDPAEYLWIAQKGTGHPPYRARIPEGSPEVDTSEFATFAETAWLRYGYEDAGQVNLPKVLLSVAPRTRNLTADGPTVTVATRTAYDGSFNNIMNTDHSPAPTDPNTEQYGGVWGYVFEQKVTLNNNMGDRPIVDALTTRALRRFIDDSSSPRLDILSFTIDAKTAAVNRMGAQTRLSMEGLYTALRQARGALFPPRLVRQQDGQEWVVDLLAVAARWTKQGTGAGQAMAIDVVAQQLPTANTGISPTGPETLRYGSGAPSMGLGADGDGYIDLDTGDFYAKESGIWVLKSAGSVEWDDVLDKPAGFPLVPDPGTPSGLFLRDDGTWAAAGGGGFTEPLSLTKVFYPATAVPAAQVAVGLFADTAAPNNADGNDGDWLLRGNGTLYNKQAGVWTPIVGSTGLTNPVGDDVPLYFDTAGTKGIVWDSGNFSLDLPGISEIDVPGDSLFLYLQAPGGDYATGWELRGALPGTNLASMSVVLGDGTVTTALGDSASGFRVASPTITLTGNANGHNYAHNRFFGPTVAGDATGGTEDFVATARFGIPVQGADIVIADLWSVYAEGGIRTDGPLRINNDAAAIGMLTVTDYVEIQQADGSTIKLAVVS